jgi:2-isopropylmalate synthase
MKGILERVQDLEAEGYQFEAAEASFDLLIKKVAGTYEPKFERVHFRVNVESTDDAPAVTEATVKLRVNGETLHVVGEGDGPVNALDAALRKALEPVFPNLAQMHLVDYKVRVINSTEGTAARVRVVIESQDEDDVWSTVGVSENIIEASWLALVDSVEFKLYKDEGAVAGNGNGTA